MKGDKVFLDTNLLLYAYDAGSPVKLRAIDLHEKHKYAFWDSLVIQSAIEGGARWLFSEDLKDGQKIGDLTIRNPFFHG